MAERPPRFVTLDENLPIKNLIFAPNYEFATRIISAWASDIEDLLKEKGWPYVKLTGSQAVRSNLKDALENNPIIFAMFYCHGEYDRMFGNQDQPVIGTANVGMLKGTIVSTVSCRCGRDLADLAIKQGIYSWIGYEEIFSLWTYDEEAMEGFKESANTANISILNDKTTGQAYKDTINEYNKWIQYYMDKTEDPMSFHYKATLIGDRDKLVVKGRSDISRKLIES